MIGTSLGPYRIVEKLGEGGMGQVYRARDARLGRDVAVKVLPGGVSADLDRIRRFEQEARAAAALNHPNILAVYDVGEHGGAPYIVSELLEGQTLGEVLGQERLPVRKAVDFAIQIARGLAAAHDRGIVHRDLKPDNVFITADGRAKILDFGLAKLVEPPDPGQTRGTGNQTTLATTAPPTTPGIVLGTVGYMAPEQVRGLSTDHRCDIFAFGAVLYEMLTGRRAFRRDTAAETMAAILNSEPPAITSEDDHIPPALERIVHRCLEKQPALRFKSADDLAFALETLLPSSTAASPSGSAAATTTVAAPRRRTGLLLIAAAIVVSALAVGTALYLRPAKTETQLYRFNISPPDGYRLSLFIQSMSPLLVSPDGKSVAGRGLTADGRSALWVRTLDEIDSHTLPGTDGTSYFFWSPDSRWIAFTARNKLSKIELATGTVTTIADVPFAFGGSWGSKDEILLGTPMGLQRVSAAGGTLTQERPLAENEAAHVAPWFFPDGEHYAFGIILGHEVRGGAPRALDVGTLGSSARTRLFEPAQFAVPLAYGDGLLLFARNNRIHAQPFDLARVALSGQPAQVVDRVQNIENRPFLIASAAPAGPLAYVVQQETILHQLAWHDRSGKLLSTIGEPADYANLELSPDNSRLAVAILESGQRGRDIWLIDLVRNVRTRFTFEAGEERTVAWWPDNSRVVYNSQRKATERELYVKASNGAGGESILLEDGLSKDPLGVSPDGQLLMYRESGRNGNDIWIKPVSQDAKPRALSATFADENYGKFSPDGRWVAYVSDETGQPEVYVAPVEGAGKWQVSTIGGDLPRWRGDGRELFYVGLDGTMMATTVDGSGAAFQIGVTTALFNVPLARQQGSSYVVTRDGQRFILLTDEAARQVSIVVVSDWRSLTHR